ncbi:MAG TPA: hypothetical protein VFX96_14095 [Pyrinomonadaceae bacterium]|nr:hypothetical protein [Pyrinomonadaceae bacterium]
MIHTLKCPTCGAPLDYDDARPKPTVRCNFCNNTVVVPAEMRPRASTFGGGPHVKININPTSVVKPVTAVVVSIVVAFTVVTALSIYWAMRQGTPPQKPNIVVNMPQMPKNFPGVPQTPPNENSFAREVLKFGGEGTGPGYFTDARHVATDGEGRIYVADYIGGRVQAFDREGKFLHQWMVDAKMPLRSLAADRRGTVYVVQKGKIARFEGTTGQPLGELSVSGDFYFDDVKATADGGLVAASRRHRDDIVRMDSTGRVLKVIEKAVSGQTDSAELNLRVTTDGVGNIYALGTFNDAVFKFTPEGRYVNRFGGDGDKPGQFRAPDSVAVDNQGRVYVTDSKGVQVFDADGRYLDLIRIRGAIDGIVFNDRNELLVAARTQIYKFALNNP